MYKNISNEITGIEKLFRDHRSRALLFNTSKKQKEEKVKHQEKQENLMGYYKCPN